MKESLNRVPNGPRASRGALPTRFNDKIAKQGYLILGALDSTNQPTVGYALSNNVPSNSFSSQGDMQVHFSPKGGLYRTEQYSAADFLLNSGIPTVINAKHQIAHNKVILIDGRTVMTGSFNFTTNAEKSNAENLLIIHDRPDLYAAYEANMRIHFEHSEKYVFIARW